MGVALCSASLSAWASACNWSCGTGMGTSVGGWGCACAKITSGGKMFAMTGNGPRVAAVLLAAGESTRMHEMKALLPWLGGRSLLAHQAHALAEAGYEPIVTVLGHLAERLRQVLTGPEPLQIVENPRYREGRTTSITAGLGALQDDVEAVLIVSVDQPRSRRAADRAARRVARVAPRHSRAVARRQRRAPAAVRRGAAAGVARHHGGAPGAAGGRLATPGRARARAGGTIRSRSRTSTRARSTRLRFGSRRRRRGTTPGLLALQGHRVTPYTEAPPLPGSPSP